MGIFCRYRSSHCWTGPVQSLLKVMVFFQDYLAAASWASFQLCKSALWAARAKPEYWGKLLFPCAVVCTLLALGVSQGSWPDLAPRYIPDHKHHAHFKPGNLLRTGEPPAWVLLILLLPVSGGAYLPFCSSGLDIYCDCCIFTGLSMTLHTLYQYWYPFSCFIKLILISRCPLLFLISPSWLGRRHWVIEQLLV